MERNPQEELKARLVATNEEFRRLVDEHSSYARQLEELLAKSHLNEQDQMQEVRLKKLKLHAKDRMEAFLSRHRAQHVA